jgi:hypothetical protein
MKANGCNNDSQDRIRIEVEKRSIRKRQLSHIYQSGHRKQDWQNTYNHKSLVTIKVRRPSFCLGAFLPTEFGNSRLIDGN